jgi:hypothetical protein
MTSQDPSVRLLLMLTAALLAYILTMAPISYGDRINTASMAGTWLGTFFTAIGLIALMTQLQTFLKNLRGSRRFLLEKSTGEWATLLPRYLPENGLAEGILPGFIGWVQNAYKTDLQIRITQDDRQTAGSSGWSKLFAHCGITAQSLLEYGGQSAIMMPAVTGKLNPKSVPLADTIVEEGRILYGFSRYEFVALMIITGNAIEVFSLSASATSTKYLGTVLMASTEPVPFAQLARFDPYEGIRAIQVKDDNTRYVTDVPIQRSINYALGFLESRISKHRPYIIPAECQTELMESCEYPQWETKPRIPQLRRIKHSFEQIVCISGAPLMDYSQQNYDHSQWLELVLKDILPSVNQYSAKNKLAIELGLAMAALQPWSVLPVLPRSFVLAFQPLILPYVGDRESNISSLQGMMKQHCLQPTAGWETVEEQANALTLTGDIRTEFFCHSANTCCWYYQAMELVFHARNLDVEQVRITLATKITERHLESSEPGVQAKIRTLLSYGTNSTNSKCAPDWAVSIYAAFIWAWVSDAVDMPEIVFERFKRRVFLA